MMYIDPTSKGGGKATSYSERWDRPPQKLRVVGIRIAEPEDLRRLRGGVIDGDITLGRESAGEAGVATAVAGIGVVFVVVGEGVGGRRVDVQLLAVDAEGIEGRHLYRLDFLSLEFDL
ncbi:uncharacterized protein G2W53_042596 [Senna tora]|uniref:Uncharacterized protein n=1 Tax=Senna tora TaxID=362788 RepID=A0A834SFL7_9FABA|nr:uncharacterized protein G2W53_042596 [Senna tora]